jgi:hypothetical protein
MSGLQADARSLVEHARVECQNHAFHYAEPLRVESTTQAICDLALRFGETGDDDESVMSRPFGVALLIAGYDEDGPQLYVEHLQHHIVTCSKRPVGRFCLPTVVTNLSLRSGITPSHLAHFTDMMQRPSGPEAKVRRRNYRTNTIVP